MKFTLAAITLLAGFAVALPANSGQLSAQQDAADAKVAAGQKANSNANAAANNGAGGIKAADAAEAAVLLTDNGDAGAVEQGKAFEDAIQKIKQSGNQDEINTLTAAGIDVNKVAGGN